MRRRAFLLMAITSLTGFVVGCKGVKPSGPGFIVTYSSSIANKEVVVTSVDLPDGPANLTVPPQPASDKNWRRRGSTESIVGDDRGIPPWIVFNWQLWPYPYPTPVYPDGDAAWQREIDRLKVVLPVYCSHVSVGERVPQDAVQLVIDSREAMKKGDLSPDKKFWFYFVWTDDGVKFRWELRSRSAHATIRSGGDDLD